MSTLLNPAELRRRGLEILVRELGYADAMRFMMQYERGHGDYTKERADLLRDLTVDELIREADELEARKKNG